MKKSNSRRKAPSQQKKGHRRPSKAAASASAPPPRRVDNPSPPRRQQEVNQPPPARRADDPGLFRSFVSQIDWLGIAILVIPLLVMVWLNTGRREAVHGTHSPLPAQGIAVRAPPQASPTSQDDLGMVTVPVPEPSSHLTLALSEPPTTASPAFPEPTSPPAAPLTLTTPEPPPTSAHGDGALEATPPNPVDERDSAPRVIGHASAAAMPLPICLPEHAGPPPAAGEPSSKSLSAGDFGRALARAAHAQTEGFVVYNPRYVTIAYPLGDTRSLYGVCTDVVIRAYRALGIDLQELIHTSRLGRGDPSIDHRRVEIVGRFFTRHGTKLEASEFGEDYRPGDIVTYHRPQGRVSQHHIAVVSDQIGPSGRPLIIHNRGWGPQVEDALFVDRMTGHYRFNPSHVQTYAQSRQPPAIDRDRRGARLSVVARH